MPALAAAPSLAGILWGSGIAAGGAVAGGLINARSQGGAAKRQVEASNYAADLQDRAAREALEYQKQQAAEEARRYEIDRRANYDQWAAREGRLGSLSQIWGFGGRPIPGYVPGTPNTSSGPAPDLSDAQAKFNALFPGETLTPDMVKAKEAELKAAGFTLRPNAAGVVGKIQYGSGPIIDIIQGASSGVNKKQWLLPQDGGGSAMGSLRDLARATPPPTWTGTPITTYRAPSTLRGYLRSR